MERLQKYLASCGIASRRASEAFIEGGRVTVNGEIAQLGCKIDPDSDVVLLDGKSVKKEDFVYLLLNKPEGLVTTVTDTHDRETVMDCLDGVKARVYPVGRLDMDVGGVLLFTNDGEFANRLIHPRYKIPKVYLAWVWGHVEPDTIAALCRGVELEDGMTAPAKVRIVERTHKQTLLRLEIYEGKNREVKRMCIAVGHRIGALMRVAFGDIRITDLEPGEWRDLSDNEVATLKRKTGL